jgi:high-affinity nickel permease
MELRPVSPDTNRPTPGPGPQTYMLGVAKKLWLCPTLAFILAVVGDLLGYNQNWNIVTTLVAFGGVLMTARLLGTKRTTDGTHLANGNGVFLFMALLQAALIVGCFFSGGYIFAVLLFLLLVVFASLFLWGCDVNLRIQARKNSGES